MILNIKEVLNHASFRRISVLVVLGLLVVSLKSMMNVLLLTLILIILIGSLYRAVTKRLSSIVRLPPALIVISLYVLLLSVVAWGVYRMVPLVSTQVNELYLMIQEAFHNPHENEWSQLLVTFMQGIHLESLITPGMEFLLKTSHLGTQLVLAIVLSLFFLLDTKYIGRFTASFQESRFSWFFREAGELGRLFLSTFGKVLEAQVAISLINCTITTAVLWLMGFPNLLGLAVVIFAAGLIPVAGVVLSMAPLSLIAYSLGGLHYVAYLLILIVFIHMLEAYFLNPKLMSKKVSVPIFYTFIVLVMSEHFFGMWGLITGIPLFVFALNLIGFKKKDAAV
ncbi:AI-2E family transporter [Paenibacillus massiliensis]|uniref:AI-2E family transporter n=1 Tax=Paenibacillus massiliensis TaxID=225917 RepID=UPI000562EEF0|nr:AI-2E family transporter [Paenibacillus massiliensis]